MEPDPEPQLGLGQVAQLELAALVKQIEGHRGDLARVVRYAHRTAAHHHVRVAYRLHLRKHSHNSLSDSRISAGAIHRASTFQFEKYCTRFFRAEGYKTILFFKSQV